MPFSHSLSLHLIARTLIYRAPNSTVVVFIGCVLFCLLHLILLTDWFGLLLLYYDMITRLWFENVCTFFSVVSNGSTWMVYACIFHIIAWFFFVGFFFHHDTVSWLKRLQMKILIRLMLAFGIVEAAMTVCAFDAVEAGTANASLINP